DCIDNDFDGTTDRESASCPAPADGGDQGVHDLVRGTALAKCQSAIQRAGDGFASKRLARLQKCVTTAFACVQLKPGDAACLGKAGDTCDKSFADITADEGKLAAAITKACSAPTVAAADLLDPSGLGYAGEDAPCIALGSGSLGSALDVIDCV